ncbi:hypothetical protein H4582DRAFT_1824628, partial [Lactarius indigo]
VTAGIHQVIGNAMHETAYRPVSTIIQHHHTLLWNVAKSLKYTAYAKQLEEDPTFRIVLNQVLKGCISAYHSSVEHVATGKVEGFYQLTEGLSSYQKIEALTMGSTYIYPTKPVSTIPTAKCARVTYQHAVLQELFFAHSHGSSLASKHQNCFKSSLPATHPVKPEISAAMLALVATCIHSTLDNFHSGVQKKSDFNTDWYEDVYKMHMEFLSHICDGSVTKYHQLMAGLYSQVS